MAGDNEIVCSNYVQMNNSISDSNGEKGENGISVSIKNLFYSDYKYNFTNS